MNAAEPHIPLQYPCKRCGDGTKVTIADAPAHRDRFHPSKWDAARVAARAAAAQRMADPEFQAKLQAARAAKREPAKEGE